MRVGVVGAGATGGYFGGLLARAGHDVTFVARGRQLDEISRRGLRLRTLLAGDFTVAAKAVGEGHQAGRMDLVLFCVKTYDTDMAVGHLPSMIDSDTWVLSVQNGVDGAERLAEIVGEDHVIGAVAQVSAQLMELGEIIQMAGPGKLIIGERSGGASLRTAQISQAFEHAAIPSDAHPQIRNAVWEKFLLICGLSGITALTRLPMGSVLGCPESKALFCEIMTEVEAVARAHAIALQDGCVNQTIALLASLSPALRGSMAHDLAAGRRLELEALNGMVVALGRKHGVATPVNDVVYGALKPYAGGPPVAP